MGFDLEKFRRAGGKPGDYYRLYDFSKAVERGETPRPELLRELAGAFNRIMDGQDPARALGLKKRQGRRITSQAQVREIHIAMLVVWLCLAGFPLEANDPQGAGAFAEVAGAVNAAEATVRRLYGKHRKSAILAVKMRLLGVLAADWHKHGKDPNPDVLALLEKLPQPFALTAVQVLAWHKSD